MDGRYDTYVFFTASWPLFIPFLSSASFLFEWRRLKIVLALDRWLTSDIFFFHIYYPSLALTCLWPYYPLLDFSIMCNKSVSLSWDFARCLLQHARFHSLVNLAPLSPLGFHPRHPARPPSSTSSPPTNSAKTSFRPSHSTSVK